MEPLCLFAKAFWSEPILTQEYGIGPTEYRAKFWKDMRLIYRSLFKLKILFFAFNRLKSDFASK